MNVFEMLDVSECSTRNELDWSYAEELHRIKTLQPTTEDEQLLRTFKQEMLESAYRNDVETYNGEAVYQVNSESYLKYYGGTGILYATTELLDALFGCSCCGGDCYSDMYDKIGTPCVVLDGACTVGAIGGCAFVSAKGIRSLYLKATRARREQEEKERAREQERKQRRAQEIQKLLLDYQEEQSILENFCCVLELVQNVYETTELEQELQHVKQKLDRGCEAMTQLNIEYNQLWHEKSETKKRGHKT